MLGRLQLGNVLTNHFFIVGLGAGERTDLWRKRPEVVQGFTLADRVLFPLMVQVSLLLVLGMVLLSIRRDLLGLQIVMMLLRHTMRMLLLRLHEWFQLLPDHVNILLKNFSVVLRRLLMGFGEVRVRMMANLHVLIWSLWLLRLLNYQASLAWVSTGLVLLLRVAVGVVLRMILWVALRMALRVTLGMTLGVALGMTLGVALWMVLAASFSFSFFFALLYY